jgi:hypothetical protein
MMPALRPLWVCLAAALPDANYRAGAKAWADTTAACRRVLRLTSPVADGASAVAGSSKEGGGGAASSSFLAALARARAAEAPAQRLDDLQIVAQARRGPLSSSAARRRSRQTASSMLSPSL